MTQMSQALDLVVIDGVQRGARFTLQNLLRTSVGISLECDVVLEPQSLVDGEGLPPGQVAPVLRLLCVGQEATIEVVSGEVFLDHQRLPSDESTMLLPGHQVKVGQSVFTVESVQRKSVLKEQFDFPATFNDGSTIQPFMPSDPAAQTAERAEPGKSPLLPRFALACCAVLGILFLVTGLIDLPGLTDEQPVTPLKLPDIATLLPVDGFEQVVVEQHSSETASVQGFVASRADYVQLTQLVAPFADRITVNVNVGEELLDSILSVYRLHGVAAEVEITEAGHASIRTAVTDETALDSIEELLLQDVTGLVQVERFNTPPLGVADNSDAKPIPGKRIVLVVASEPAYILTEDGSRYFPGSVLPNGYRIQAIHHQKVDLVRNDEHLELIF